MLQLRRCKELVSGVTITQGTLDQRAAAEGTAKADVLVAQAGIDEANINLGYSEIRSSTTEVSGSPILSSATSPDLRPAAWRRSSVRTRSMRSSGE